MVLQLPERRLETEGEKKIQQCMDGKDGSIAPVLGVEAGPVGIPSHHGEWVEEGLGWDGSSSIQRARMLSHPIVPKVGCPSYP